MRESALFLLGLLVAVSVDVVRPLVYADSLYADMYVCVCARASSDGEMYGAKTPVKGVATVSLGG